MFVKHRCPGRNKVKIQQNSFKSYILTPPHPQGQVMSVKCEEPIDEISPNLANALTPKILILLFVSGTELRKDKRSDY